MTTKEFFKIILGDDLPSKKEVFCALVIIFILYFAGLVLWAITY